jgi:multidrug efflux system outer membrane protein
MRRSIALVAATMLVGGCTLDPVYLRPQPPVPATFPRGDSYAPAKDAPQVGALGWQAFFTDPNLKQVIGTALAQNRDLRSAIANIQLARAQYVIQRANLLPGVNATGGELYERTPVTPGASIDERLYSAAIGFSGWQIDLFGRVRSQTRAAREQYLATAEARRAVQVSLIAEVATDYYTFAANRQLLALARQTLQAQQASLDLTRGRLDAGEASMLDVRQAETTVEQARSDVAQFTTNAAQAKNALELVVGASVPDAILPQALPDSGFVALAAGTRSEVLLQRPDVLEAEHQLKAANADIGAARAAFFPSITLTAQAGQESGALSSLFSGAARTWLFEPNLTLPIFQAGRNVAGLRSAKATRDAAVDAYEKAVQSAFRDVADALARDGTLGDQLGAQQALVASSADSLKLSTARYDRGADTYLNVLVAQRALYSAQQSLVSTQLTGLTNGVALYKALGGGGD